VGKKIALNSVYNLGLILSIMGIVWCFQNEKYIPCFFLVGAAVAIFYFKVQLTKEIRKSFKEKDQK
jgi:hypothetical protein